MAVQITDELRFSVTGLGFAIATIHFFAAIASVPLGRLADRLGSTRSIRLAAGLAALAFMGIAATARSWTTLVVWLVIGTVGAKLGPPAANRLLIRKVPPERLGVAFGMKQSAGPVAGMIAGLSVPVIAVTVGWRWAHVLISLFGIALMLLARRSSTGAPRVRETRAPRAVLPNRGALLVLAAAFGLQGAATTMLVVFYVPSAVAAGVSPESAGLSLAASSAGAMVVRILAGALCDRMAAGHLRMSAVLLAMGSVGVFLLALGRPVMMIVGIGLGLAAAWRQTGVFWYSLVRAYKDTPGRVTGVITPANHVGSIISPVVFGFLVKGIGYSAAWAFAGVIALLASVAMVFGGRRLASMSEAKV